MREARPIRRFTLPVAAALLHAAALSAATVPVRGLYIRIVNLHGGTGTRRSIAVKAVHDRLNPHGTAAPPDIGDPVANGLTLRIYADGATSTSQKFTLPAGAAPSPDGPGWTRTDRVTRVRTTTTFAYADPRARATLVRALLLRVQTSHGRPTVWFSLLVDGKGVNPERIDVLPPNPGTDAGVSFSSDGPDTVCLAFGGAAGGRIRDDDDETFRIARPRFRTCPGATSPSGAFVDG